MAGEGKGMKAKKEELFKLAEGIRCCTACPLWKTRTLAVPGEGNPEAKLFFVGEAPGAEEDRQGSPFVGPSGKFLDKLFKKNKIKREKVFLTGAVKCYPPKTRDPKLDELKICKELWLNKQISIIKPKLIVILGTIALKSLLKEKEIKELHGKIIKKNKQKYFITFHPAAGRRFPKVRKEMEKDFGRLKKLVRNF